MANANMDVAKLAEIDPEFAKVSIPILASLQVI
jgi:hypothetical protein